MFIFVLLIVFLIPLTLTDDPLLIDQFIHQFPDSVISSEEKGFLSITEKLQNENNKIVNEIENGKIFKISDHLKRLNSFVESKEKSTTSNILQKLQKIEDSIGTYETPSSLNVVGALKTIANITNSISIQFKVLEDENEKKLQLAYSGVQQQIKSGRAAGIKNRKLAEQTKKNVKKITNNYFKNTNKLRMKLDLIIKVVVKTLSSINAYQSNLSKKV